jgi:hypothetical protein
MTSKLSAKTVATTWAATDYFGLVRAGSDIRMTLEDLFTEIPLSPIIKHSDGLQIDRTSGDDGDVNLVTCLVTGTPKFSWDESADGFALSKGLAITGPIYASSNFKTYSTLGKTVTAIGDSVYSIGGTAIRNTFIGYGIAHRLLNTDVGGYTACDNVAIGHAVMQYLEPAVPNDSRRNVGIGSQCLACLDAGSANIALGYKAAYFLTVGRNNVAIGDGTLMDAVDNEGCVGVGIEAIMSVGGAVPGTRNYVTGIGHHAAYGNLADIFGPICAGNYSTWIGAWSGGDIQSFAGSTHANATALGSYAGYHGGTNGLYLGYKAGKYADVDNEFYLDTLDRTTTELSRTNGLMYGRFNATPASQVLRLNAQMGILTPGDPTATVDWNATSWRRSQYRAEWYGTVTFTATANQLAYVNLGDILYIGCVEVEVYSGYSGCSAEGRLIRRFTVEHFAATDDPGARESEIASGFGQIAGAYAIGPLRCVSNAVQIPIYNVAGKANVLRVHVRLYATVAAYINDALTNLAIVAPAVALNPGRVQYNSIGGAGNLGRLSIGYGDALYSLSVLNGNILAAHPANGVGSETLTNGSLTAGTSWTAVGDFALGSDKAIYTHATAVGTLTQASGTLAIPAVGNRIYRLTFTISGWTPGCRATITNAFAASEVVLDLVYGANTVYFLSKSSPGDFVISVTSTAGGFSIDTLSLKEITAGDVKAMGSFTGGGISGIKIDGLGNVGIGQTSFGTSAAKVFAMATDTPPGSSPLDAWQMYSADQAPGNACPHIRTEHGETVKLFQGVTIADPAGGGTTDAEARAAICTIIDRLQGCGLIA